MPTIKSLYEQTCEAWDNDEWEEEEARELDKQLAEKLQPLMDMYDNGQIGAHEFLQAIVYHTTT